MLHQRLNILIEEDSKAVNININVQKIIISFVVVTPKRFKNKLKIFISNTCSGFIKTEINGIKHASENNSNIDVKIIKNRVNNN